MCMNVTVKTQPTTLNEAELAEKIHAAVVQLIEESGATSKTIAGKYPYHTATEGKDGTFIVSLPIDERTHCVHVDGAYIPARMRLVRASE